jgi:D-alanine-D-alanine ligase
MSASHASTLLGTRVLLLKGGPDAEREVSLKSGAMVAAALRRAGLEVNEITVDRPGLDEIRAMHGDVVFPVLHGSWGEGGPLQELLEADGRPYVGCDPKAARIAMDKVQSKKIVGELGVPTPRAQ